MERMRPVRREMETRVVETWQGAFPATRQLYSSRCVIPHQVTRVAISRDGNPPQVVSVEVHGAYVTPSSQKLAPGAWVPSRQYTSVRYTTPLELSRMPDWLSELSRANPLPQNLADWG